MKKLVTMAVAILLTACIAAFASGKNPGVPQKQFNYQLSFSKIVVADDIELQLKESNDKVIDVTGKDSDVEKVDWKIKDDVLYLTSRRGSLKNKVTVSVDVTKVKEILIKGKSTVKSAGVLHSPELYVYIEDDCFVSIKNLGQIYLMSDDDTEIKVKKVVGHVHINY